MSKDQKNDKRRLSDKVIFAANFKTAYCEITKMSILVAIMVNQKAKK